MSKISKSASVRSILMTKYFIGFSGTDTWILMKLVVIHFKNIKFLQKNFKI